MSIEIEVKQVCEWKSLPESCRKAKEWQVWFSACNQEGIGGQFSPIEMGFRFCPYCGKPIVETHQEPTP